VVALEGGAARWPGMVGISAGFCDQSAGEKSNATNGSWQFTGTKAANIHGKFW